MNPSEVTTNDGPPSLGGLDRRLSAEKRSATLSAIGTKRPLEVLIRSIWSPSTLRASNE
jgi:hypothetical protein